MELSKRTSGQGSVTVARIRALRRVVFAKQEVAILISFVLITLFFYLRNLAMLSPLAVTSILRTMAFPGLIGMHFAAFRSRR